MQRDPYRPLHKAILTRLVEIGQLAGSTDFLDAPSAQHFRDEFTGLGMFLEHHAQHEDNNIHPLLHHHHVQEVSDLEAQHEAIDREFAEVQAAFESLMSEPQEHKWDAAHTFYLRYHRFVSSYLAHLCDEEMRFLPLLRQHCSEADFDELAKADFAAEDPEHLRPMLQRFLPSFNAADIALMLADVRRVVPDNVFAQYCHVFEDLLGEGNWQKVEGLLES